MNNHLIHLILLFLCYACYDLNAQEVIRGKVFDKTSGLPVENAQVYLNGSSYGSVTNDSGEYRINVPNRINTKLIISHMSYNLAVINHPFDKEPDIVWLDEKAVDMDEVVVVPKAGHYTRKQLLKAFEQQFFGNNNGRLFCNIRNKEDIYLYYNETEKTLSAKSEQPLSIENKYLGYDIYCMLTDFKISYINKRSIKAENVANCLMRFHAFFTDLSPENLVVKKRRDEVYKSSANYFFKNLANRTLNLSNHSLYNRNKKIITDLDHYFDIKDNGSETFVQIKSPEEYSINFGQNDTFKYPVLGSVFVEDHAGHYSNIHFFTDTYSIDRNGVVDKWDYIGLTGHMGNQRMGYMLPSEYVFTDDLSASTNRIISPTTNLAALFENQLAIFPQEKIYVHTDKPYYISGERIWFRAHMADAATHAPVSASRYVYVELVNPLDSIVTRIKILEEGGAYHGHLHIPDTIPEGDYTLRAYTHYMRSQDDNYFFTKTVRIGDPLSRSVHLTEEFEFSTERRRERIDAILRFSQIDLTGAFVSFAPQAVRVTVNEGKPMKINVEENGTARFRFDLPHTSRKRVILLEASVGKNRYGKYIPVPTPDDDFDVTFYPEGGSLMQGTFCKVAFKAMKSNGQATPVSGVIYDQDGNKIRTMETTHLGMGVFLHQSEKNKTYYAVCENEQGQSKRFDLPAALDKGYALSISSSRDKIYVKVEQPAEAVQNEKLYLFAHTRGVEQLTTVWDQNSNISVFQKEKFPSGVLHFILFDSGMHPVSERLIFIHNPDQALVNYRNDSKHFVYRSLVKNTVTVTDSDGEPAMGSFSVSVTSDKAVTPDSTSHILTHLLLSSDLRSHIENPAYYFQNENTSIFALDLLMLTQGWRRYNIAELALGRYARPTMPIEAGAEIAGTVKSLLLGKSVENIAVTLLSESGYFNATKTDKDGRFYMNSGDLPDSIRYIVAAIPKKGMTRMELFIDEETFPRWTSASVPFAVEIEKQQFTKYVDKAEQQYINEHGMRTYNLPEVAVTATKKRVYKESPYYHPVFLSQFKVINEQDLEEKYKNFSNLEQLLSFLPAFRNFVRVPNSLYADAGPLWVIDGVYPSSPAGLMVMDIAQIALLTGPDAAIFGIMGSGGVIVIDTKRGTGVTNRPTPSFHAKSLTPLGYQKPVEFYAPKYDTPEKRDAPIADLRTTIHWQPVVQVDSSGEATFEFYTADENTSYTVVIEGLTTDGRIIRKAVKLWEHY